MSPPGRGQPEHSPSARVPLAALAKALRLELHPALQTRLESELASILERFAQRSGPAPAAPTAAIERSGRAGARPLASSRADVARTSDCAAAILEHAPRRALEYFVLRGPLNAAPSVAARQDEKTAPADGAKGP